MEQRGSVGGSRKRLRRFLCRLVLQLRLLLRFCLRLLPWVMPDFLPVGFPLRGFRFFLSGKICVPFPAAYPFGGLPGFIHFHKTVTGHFLRDFIAGLILFYVFPPPIRALARTQYSALISMPI